MQLGSPFTRLNEPCERATTTSATVNLDRRKDGGGACIDEDLLGGRGLQRGARRHQRCRCDRFFRRDRIRYATTARPELRLPPSARGPSARRRSPAPVSLPGGPRGAVPAHSPRSARGPRRRPRRAPRSSDSPRTEKTDRPRSPLLTERLDIGLNCRHAGRRRARFRALAARARVLTHPGLHLLHRPIYLVVAADVTDDVDRSREPDLVRSARSLTSVDRLASRGRTDLDLRVATALAQRAAAHVLARASVEAVPVPRVMEPPLPQHGAQPVVPLCRGTSEACPKFVRGSCRAIPAGFVAPRLQPRGCALGAPRPRGVPTVRAHFGA